MKGRRRQRSFQRRARRTVRIVCEGDAEVCLVRHLRSLYLSGGAGHSVSHRNARGRGGQRALELATSTQVRQGVDHIAILIDTDQDWDDDLRTKARQKRVHVAESAPCLEAWLLQVAGHRPPDNSAACKRAFKEKFGGEAHQEEIYSQYFNRSVFDAARSVAPVLDQLLRLMGV